MTIDREADPRNTHERLWKAVGHLVSDDASLDKRLDRARLQLALQPKEFPTPSMERAFSKLQEDLNRVRSGEVDPATVAQDVLALYSGIVHRGAGFYDSEHFDEHFPAEDWAIPPEHSQAHITWANITLMTRRLTRARNRQAGSPELIAAWPTAPSGLRGAVDPDAPMSRCDPPDNMRSNYECCRDAGGMAPQRNGQRARQGASTWEDPGAGLIGFVRHPLIDQSAMHGGDLQSVTTAMTDAHGRRQIRALRA
jgi:hypothetical protein